MLIFLFVVAAVWTFIMGVVAVIGGATGEPFPEIIELLSVEFIGPVLLIAGCILVVATRFSRSGVACVLLSCAWLTWLVGSISIPFFREHSPLQKSGRGDYALFAGFVAVTLLADIAALSLLIRIRRASNEALEPTTSRRD
jgi:hypothetical protein